MKNFFKLINDKLKTDAAKIEFWVVTVGLAIVLIFSITDQVRLSRSITANNIANGIPNANNYIAITPVLFDFLFVYVSYLLMVFIIGPAFAKKNERLGGGIVMVILIVIGCCCSRFFDAYLGQLNMYFAALLAIKLLIIYFNRDKSNVKGVCHEAALLLSCEVLLLVLLNLTPPGNSPLLIRYCFFALPIAIVGYLFAVHHLLPNASLKRLSFLYYFSGMALFAIVTCVGLGVLLDSARGNDDAAFAIFNGLTLMVVVTPLSSYVYRSRQTKKQEEIITLKTELGKSDASLNFLKSQINPHFLFNALNTLYGTALQEKAERTGEGIQKLGDMMRFMLEENVQDTILLSRDIDYLQNYIILQKLRTATSDDVTVETQIEQYTGELMITPMLLIPFVENAFKHGISLLKPSHIKVTLQTKDDTLYFDVHNTIHIRQENDPEKLQSGIGLENVKQRLGLLYPQRHELVIHQNAREFFIHLTIQLNANS